MNTICYVKCYYILYTAFVPIHMQNHLVYDIGFVFIYIFSFGMSQMFIETYFPGHKNQWFFYLGCLVIGLLIIYGKIIDIDPEAIESQDPIG